MTVNSKTRSSFQEHLTDLYEHWRTLTLHKYVLSAIKLSYFFLEKGIQFKKFNCCIRSIYSWSFHYFLKYQTYWYCHNLATCTCWHFGDFGFGSIGCLRHLWLAALYLPLLCHWLEELSIISHNIISSFNSLFDDNDERDFSLFSPGGLDWSVC